MSLNNLAKCLLETGNLREAESLHRQALDMIRRIAGNSVGTAAASQNLGECLLRRGLAEQFAGDSAGGREATEAARDAFALSLRIRRESYPSGHHLIAASLNGLARAEFQLGNMESAGEHAREAVEEFRRTRREDHPDLGLALKTVARVLEAEGDRGAAIETYEEALQIAEPVKPPDEVLIALLRSRLGHALALTDDTARGEELLLSSLAQLRSIRGDHADDTIVAYRLLVQFYQQIGQPERAQPYLRAARLSD